MRSQVTFRPYSRTDKEICLDLFDANCPEFFAPNERTDYSGFLEKSPSGYELCLIDDEVAGAFGLIGDDGSRRRLNWIMLDPRFQGAGAGRAIMGRVVSLASSEGIRVVDIAASQKSAPFFARFGAVTLKVIDDGWGRVCTASTWSCHRRLTNRWSARVRSRSKTSSCHSRGAELNR